MCVCNMQNLLNLPQFINDVKAIYLFQESPCSPCGTNLFRTNLIDSKKCTTMSTMYWVDDTFYLGLLSKVK